MKYALVTGASSGIGRSISVALARDLGYHVLVNYLSNKDEALRTVSEVEAAGGSAEIICFDVTSFEDTEAKLNAWQEKNKDATIEIVVNNAGIIKDTLMMFMKESDWDQVVDAKLKGFYNVTRCLVQKMILQKYGRIINIASLAGLRGNPGQVNYSAANGGLIAATKTLGIELAKKNITVNAIAPGYIETDMIKGLNQEQLLKLIPAQRLGKTEEIADLVSFLASKKAGYINGEVVHINGGLF